VTTIADAVEAFIRQNNNIGASDTLFSRQVDLFDYGYLDSFGIVALIEMIDQRYHVDLGGVDFYEPGNRTIDDIARLVEARVAARTATA
jgi:acyl carrier protein